MKAYPDSNGDFEIRMHVNCMVPRNGKTDDEIIQEIENVVYAAITEYTGKEVQHPVIHTNLGIYFKQLAYHKQ